MFVLNHLVKIGEYTIKGLVSCEIKRNISNLTGTATIVLPQTAVMTIVGTKLNVLTAQAFKRGDSVEISLGYNGKLKKEFSGYITRVNLTNPVEIECEDGIFLLKNKTIKKVYNSKDNATLAKVLSDIFEGTNVSIDTGTLSIDISKLLLCTKTGGAVAREIALKKVIDDYGLVAYFDTEQNLFVGLRQGKKAGTVKLKLGWNTINDDNLKYHNADDEQVKIKAIYVNKLGQRVEAEVGDASGTIRTIFLSNVESQSQLATLAQQELDKWKFNGFSGSVNCFLQPFCEPAYIVELTDPTYSERSGNYYCEGVEIIFGQNGARRKIELGAKI